MFNVLVAAQGSSDLPLNEVAATMDGWFNWLVTEQVQAMWICLAITLLAHLVKWASLRETFFWLTVIFALASFFFDERSITEVYPTGNNPSWNGVCQGPPRRGTHCLLPPLQSERIASRRYHSDLNIQLQIRGPRNNETPSSSEKFANGIRRARSPSRMSHLRLRKANSLA